MKHSLAILRYTFWTALTLCCGAAVILMSTYLYLSPKLPSVDALRNVKLQVPLRIYSSDGKLMAEFGEKRRNPIKIEDSPKLYIDALLATEDDDFENHHGISIKGLLRATAQFVTTGRKQSGGSTITMQVAKNFYLSRDKKFSRKFTEILLALQIERELSKKEILELYINKIYLGQRAYGIQSAAQVYYGKTINELDLPQLAMIAGLPQAPSAANPITNPERAFERRNHVLTRMLELSKITREQYDAAIKAPITAKYHGTAPDVNAPYVSEMVRKELISQYGESVYTEGYKVYTTIDSKLQNAANRAVQHGLSAYTQKHGFRGPETSYPPIATPLPGPALIEPNELALTVTDEVKKSIQLNISDKNKEYWVDAIQSAPSYGLFRPAVVAAIDDDKKIVYFLLSTGEAISVEWDQMKWARPYISVNRMGPIPKKPSDFLSLGDLVRVLNKNDRWELTQVPQAQSAFVSLSPNNGAILALVGGFDFTQSRFNRVTQAIRQPGSNFKPFIYSAALENGFTPATLVNDAPVVFEDDSLESTWRPENYSKKFYGPTRLREALYKSRNLVSIRVLRTLGIKKAIKFMERYGFESDKLPRDLSLALGSANMTPLDLAEGYTVFANGGYKVSSHFIKTIIDNNDNTIFSSAPDTVCVECYAGQNNLNELEQLEAEASALLANEGVAGEGDAPTSSEKLTPEGFPVAKRVLDPQTAFMINSMLKDVVKLGTAKRALTLARDDIAGKTGTTNDQVDAWFSGYNQNLVATSWVGFDQPSTLGRNAFGGSTALPIWIEYMKTALSGTPLASMPQPDGLVTVKIDPKSGMRASPGQPNAIFEIFKSGDVPDYDITLPGDGYQSGSDGGGETLPEQLF